MQNKLMTPEALLEELQGCNSVSEVNALSLLKFIPFISINEPDESGDNLGYVLFPTIPDETTIGIKIPYSIVSVSDGYEQLKVEEYSTLTQLELDQLLEEARKSIGYVSDLFTNSGDAY